MAQQSPVLPSRHYARVYTDVIYNGRFEPHLLASPQRKSERQIWPRMGWVPEYKFWDSQYTVLIKIHGLSDLQE
jgi:hypothetical protein